MVSAIEIIFIAVSLKCIYGLQAIKAFIRLPGVRAYRSAAFLFASHDEFSHTDEFSQTF